MGMRGSQGSPSGRGKNGLVGDCRGGRPRPPVCVNPRGAEDVAPYGSYPTSVRDCRGRVPRPAGWETHPLRCLSHLGAGLGSLLRELSERQRGLRELSLYQLSAERTPSVTAYGGATSLEEGGYTRFKVGNSSFLIPHSSLKKPPPSLRTAVVFHKGTEALYTFN